MNYKDFKFNHTEQVVSDELPLVLEGMTQVFSQLSNLDKPSSHPYYELTYVRQGGITYFIAGKSYHLAQGSAIIIKPNVPHTFEVAENCDLANVYFALSSKLGSNEPQLSHSASADDDEDAFIKFLRLAEASNEELDEFDESSQLRDEALELDKAAPCITINGRARHEIADTMERIFVEEEKESYGKTLMLQGLGLQLLVELSRAIKNEWEERRCLQKGDAKDLVKLACQFMETNYDLDLTNEDIANYVYLSQGYFSRVFREETGHSPMNYLSLIRVDEGMTLLEETDHKVSTIAKLLGYSSTQRFNSAFRKHVGATPLAYRQHFLESEAKRREWERESRKAQLKKNA